jgi:hypothetical protein
VIYKFKSKGAGDVIMLGPTGDRLLRAMGREPAVKGIIEVDALPAAIAALEQAVADDEAAFEQARQDAQAKGEPLPQHEGGVSLRQRAWPLVEMMRRCLTTGDEIVWGV